MSLVIDFEHHFVPPDIIEHYASGPGGSESSNLGDAKADFSQGVPASPIARTKSDSRIYSIDEHIRDMDEAGIDVSVLSSSAGFHANLAACKILNEKMAEAVGKYPERLVALAHVPATDGEAAIQEVRRAVGELRLRGVAIPCFYKGLNVDSRRLWPFYQAVSSLGIPILIHPSMVPSTYDLVPSTEYDLHRALVREFDLMVAVTRLVFSGVLSTFPDLKVIVCHFGGGIAAMRERIQRWQVTFDPPKQFENDFRKLYFAASGYENANIALQCALMGIGADRLVFGTDYPYDFQGGGAQMRSWVEKIRGSGLTKIQTDKVLGKNAADLLKLGS